MPGAVTAARPIRHIIAQAAGLKDETISIFRISA